MKVNNKSLEVNQKSKEVNQESLEVEGKSKAAADMDIQQPKLGNLKER